MIELIDVGIAIGRQTLDKISIAIPASRYAVLMGKTGVGKTSILEAICGLRPITSGILRLGGCDVGRLGPGERDIGYVPQDLALFPNLSVRQHLDFALRLRRWSRADIESRVQELAAWLDIEPILPRGVANLSGGEGQRVALGRALSFRPSVLLLDEPLSALDDITRENTQRLLADVNRVAAATVLHVTHNRSEAMALADVLIELDRDRQSGSVSIRTTDVGKDAPPCRSPKSD